MCHAIACLSPLIVTVASIGETGYFWTGVPSYRLADASAAEVGNALQLFVVEEEVECPDIAFLPCECKGFCSID